MEENTSIQPEDTQDTMLLTWGCMSYLIAFGSVGYGLYKLFVYYNSTLDSLKKNAYVGGDAYNYIINGTARNCLLRNWLSFCCNGHILLYC